MHAWSISGVMNWRRPHGCTSMQPGIGQDHTWSSRRLICTPGWPGNLRELKKSTGESCRRGSTKICRHMVGFGQNCRSRKYFSSSIGSGTSFPREVSCLLWETATNWLPCRIVLYSRKFMIRTVEYFTPTSKWPSYSNDVAVWVSISPRCARPELR